MHVGERMLGGGGERCMLVRGCWEGGGGGRDADVGVTDLQHPNEHGGGHVAKRVHHQGLHCDRECP
jgi:hypothetical protein